MIGANKKGITNHKIALDDGNLAFQSGLLAQLRASLNMPGVVCDPNDLAADCFGDGAGRAANAAAKIQHLHPWFEAGNTGKLVLISCHAVGYRLPREDGGVMESLAPSLLVERRDKIIVVRSDFVVFLCAGGSFFHRGVADGIVVDDI